MTRESTAFRPWSVNALLFSIFSALGLALLLSGVYSVSSILVATRTKEMAIRLALGARARDVVALVVGRGVAVASTGAALGLLGALALTRFLESLLFQVDATDPATYVMVVVVVLLAALVASLVPARRAARVDPLVALKYE